MNDYIDIIGNTQPVQLTDDIGPLPPAQLNDYIGIVGNTQPVQLTDDIRPLPPAQLNDYIGTIDNSQPVQFNDDIGGESDSLYAVKNSSSYESNWEESDADELVEITKQERNTCDYIISY